MKTVLLATEDTEDTEENSNLLFSVSSVAKKVSGLKCRGY